MTSGLNMHYMCASEGMTKRENCFTLAVAGKELVVSVA